MKMNFRKTSVDGEELVMDTSKLDVKEIRFNRYSRDITITYAEPKPVAKKAVKKAPVKAKKK